MKSLILKDFYNILHNIKSLLFVLIVIAIAFIPSSQITGYIFMCAILCSMMIVTTFSFDEKSKWTKYAMITPITGKDVVGAKFITLVAFCMFGTIFGLSIGTLGSIFIQKVSFPISEFGELLIIVLLAFLISIIFGSVSIALVFRFGAENGRVLLFASFLLPAALFYGLYRLLDLIGVTITEQLIFLLLCCAPAITIVWCFMMFRISYRIFSKQEL